MTNHSTRNRSNYRLNCYLHIYRVVPKGREFELDTESASSFVSVASLGKTREQAEQVAINLVHQHDYHILATDTATAAPWLSEQSDLPYLQDLSRYGVALQELAA